MADWLSPVEPWRIAQIIVHRSDDPAGAPSGRGSGYLVAPGRVLTAAHVLTDAVRGSDSVTVLLDVGQPDQIRIQVSPDHCTTDAVSDLAVITIPDTAHGDRPCPPVAYGRVGTHEPAVLRVETFGYPAFKLRTGDPTTPDGQRVRDLEHTTGTVPVLANRRTGTLAVNLDKPAPAPTPDDEDSPWAGMSGAPLWASGRIVGVIAEHHRTEGTGRLTARRLHNGRQHDPTDLSQLLDLPADLSDLPDVVPQPASVLIRAAYVAQVRDIAPDQLLDRDDELAEWASFCAGPSSEPYAWWQGGPWTGKTALAAWFVTHPPAGLEIVSFFITRRLAGQADSDAFLAATLDQLRTLVPTDLPYPTTAAARHGQWRDLLDQAAEQTAARGQRLVLVVDGLDEDETGAMPTPGHPSIASLLPRKPHPNLRVAITSRPHPGLPDDVPNNHPLGALSPLQLHRPAITVDIERNAKSELHHILLKGGLGVDIIGYLTASGGGLGFGDLADLCGAPDYVVEPLIRGTIGRSLNVRSSAVSESKSEAVIFAHESLHDRALNQFRNRVETYRLAIHAWMDGFRSQGWPSSTPAYAINGYSAMLAATGDRQRLVRLALDVRRQNYLLRETGTDSQARHEIELAYQAIDPETPEAIADLLSLATWRHTLDSRGSNTSKELIFLWAILGRWEHAEDLARGIYDPRRRSEALDMLTTMRGSQNHQIAPPELVWSRAARAVNGLYDRPEGDVTRARAAVEQALQAHALSALGRFHLEAALTRLNFVEKRTDQALQCLDSMQCTATLIQSTQLRSEVLTMAGFHMFEANYPEHAATLAAKAEAASRSLPNEWLRDTTLKYVSIVAATWGSPPDAALLANEITDEGARIDALAAVARELELRDSADATAYPEGRLADLRGQALGNLSAEASVEWDALRSRDLDRLIDELEAETIDPPPMPTHTRTQNAAARRFLAAQHLQRTKKPERAARMAKSALGTPIANVATLFDGVTVFRPEAMPLACTHLVDCAKTAWLGPSAQDLA